MSGARQLDRFAAFRRLVLGSALLVAALAGAGCFKPKIAEGGFKCADGGVCPEGFQCDYAQGAVCVTHLSDGGAGKGGKGGVGGTGGTGGMAGQPPVSCFDAKPDCEPSDAGICDPFCQSGCAGCRDKCSVNTLAALTCNEPTTTTLVGTLGACSVTNSGTDAQADDCAPGHVCLEEECFPRCYRFCRSDNDCNNAGCDRTVAGSTQKACDVEFKDTCSPLPGSGNTGCGTGSIACYISSAHPDRTLCDCPFQAVGEGKDCKRSRDCIPGLACSYVMSQGKSQCLQVCDLNLAVNGSDCINGGGCRVFRGALGTGTPHVRYGVCF